MENPNVTGKVSYCLSSDLIVFSLGVSTVPNNSTIQDTFTIPDNSTIRDNTHWRQISTFNLSSSLAVEKFRCRPVPRPVPHMLQVWPDWPDSGASQGRVSHSLRLLLPGHRGTGNSIIIYSKIQQDLDPTPPRMTTACLTLLSTLSFWAVRTTPIKRSAPSIHDSSCSTDTSEPVTSTTTPGAGPAGQPLSCRQDQRLDGRGPHLLHHRHCR